MNTASQREAVAKLCTYCERLLLNGSVAPIAQVNLRHYVDETCAAFDMAPVQDRLEQDLQLIREAMAS